MFGVKSEERMRRTGIFFHYQSGERLRDFPSALGDILNRENIVFYDALYKESLAYGVEPVKEDLLFRVHSKHMIERIKKTQYYEGALYSAGGTVQAVEKILGGEIDNAFVFTGFGDHHAGRDFFSGGCYLNGAALAIENSRARFGARRFAVGDTDPHHGDGTWDIFKDDEDVLYTCFCSGGLLNRKNNINIKVPFYISDEEYLKKVEEQFVPRAIEFGPELIFWNFGYDGTQGEYGDIGLTMDCHPGLAEVFKDAAERACEGRLVVILCGGTGRKIATYAIPKIIGCLAG
jgi:acetoin utilization deacetylase AcuC-like enzyme